MSRLQGLCRVKLGGGRPGGWGAGGSLVPEAFPAFAPGCASDAGTGVAGKPPRASPAAAGALASRLRAPRLPYRRRIF